MDQLPTVPIGSDLDLWSAIIGFLLPPLIAVVVQSRWPNWVRGLVAGAACLVCGAVTAALAGQFTGYTPARCVLIVLIMAIGFYRMFWHPSGIAPRIEQATNRQQTWRPFGPV